MQVETARLALFQQGQLFGHGLDDATLPVAQLVAAAVGLVLKERQESVVSGRLVAQALLEMT